MKALELIKKFSVALGFHRPAQLSLPMLIARPHKMAKRPAQRKYRQSSPPGISSPELLTLWHGLRQLWFPKHHHLDHFCVRWSRRRQKRTLGSCNLKQHQVVLANELRDPAHAGWLEPLLYHEMCHAVLATDLPRRNGKTPWHGKEFKALVRRHPATRALERWIKDGGWGHAVRSSRAKAANSARARMKQEER